eukprot:SAG31_NODE_37_length_31616_cov_38.688359_9_plen_968_part_00
MCSCVLGWEGQLCADDVDECYSDPCWHGSVCSESTSDSNISTNAFQCGCLAGFEGPVCAIDINECESAPCQNGGTCLDSSSGNSTAFGAYDCICVGGWDGENCFADVDDCLSMPCQNGATCSDAGTNSYVCVCVFGWENVNCDVQVNPCLNGDHECAEQATCAHIGPGMFNCFCIAGWEGDGRSCADVDECLSSPCQNGASCADSTSDTSLAVDFYNCNCSTGWMSDNCVQDVDECASSPCENGGTCYDSTTSMLGLNASVSVGTIQSFAGPFIKCAMLGNNLGRCEAGVEAEECGRMCLQRDDCLSIDFEPNEGRCCLGRSNRVTTPTSYCCDGPACVTYRYYEPRRIASYSCHCSSLFMGESCGVRVVPGCTDVSAFNYNPLANVDDGGCIAVRFGCMLPTAFNYDPFANTELGEFGGCVDVINGCTNIHATNYDPSANTDDGSCNINPCAVDENHCDLSAFCYHTGPDQFECECREGFVGNGETCAAAISGCTDPEAVNFDPLAHEDDGSCFFDPCSIGADTCTGDSVCIYAGPDAYVCDCGPSYDWDGFQCEPIPVRGCTFQDSMNYDPLADLNDGSCILRVRGCSDASAFNYDAAVNTDDGSCIARLYGCTDEAALNFNPDANTNFDGACIARIFGCTNARAINFDPRANTDDASCDINVCTSNENDCGSFTNVTCIYTGPGQHACVCAEGWVATGAGGACVIESIVDPASSETESDLNAPVPEHTNNSTVNLTQTTAPEPPSPDENQRGDNATTVIGSDAVDLNHTSSENVAERHYCSSTLDLGSSVTEVRLSTSLLELEIHFGSQFTVDDGWCYSMFTHLLRGNENISFLQAVGNGSSCHMLENALSLSFGDTGRMLVGDRLFFSACVIVDQRSDLLVQLPSNILTPEAVIVAPAELGERCYFLVFVQLLEKCGTLIYGTNRESVCINRQVLHRTASGRVSFWTGWRSALGCEHRLDVDL